MEEGVGPLFLASAVWILLVPARAFSALTLTAFFFRSVPGAPEDQKGNGEQFQPLKYENSSYELHTAPWDWLRLIANKVVVRLPDGEP